MRKESRGSWRADLQGIVAHILLDHGDRRSTERKDSANLYLVDLVVLVGAGKCSGASKLSVFMWCSEEMKIPKFDLREKGFLETKWEMAKATRISDEEFYIRAEDIDSSIALFNRIKPAMSGGGWVIESDGNCVCLYNANRYINNDELTCFMKIMAVNFYSLQ